ncbi:hypothetical protein V6238_18375 [Marinomonas arenicola]|uniref:hypothetical protein n=1 Tax=Marinomonas arenicola TaxID=569601 RepID=UPI00311DC66C
MTMPKKEPFPCYSHNDETFQSDLSDTYSEIESESDIGDEITILVGMSEPKAHSDFVSIDDLIDGAQQRAYEYAPEHADDYLDDIDKEKRKELEKIVINWLNKNTEQPSFWGVGQTKVHLEGHWDGKEISPKQPCIECEDEYFEKELKFGLCPDCSDNRGEPEGGAL